MGKIINIIKRAIGADTGSKSSAAVPAGAHVIPRNQHTVSRKMISDNAVKVLYRLNKEGYGAYLVGGGVRDSLLGHEPKDFDIATDARPEQIRRIFRNCRLIGKRFRLAHIYFKDEIIEVATFRAGNEQSAQHERSDQGVVVRDNVYGSLEDDIWRRDFTINALYYNIADFSVLDYAGGMQDLEQGIIRMIGDPQTRYQEDPVRMLRAVRFAAKLGFTIHPDTEKPIAKCRELLSHISNARLFDECLKLFLTGCGSHTYSLLRHYDLFGCLFPETEKCLSDKHWHQATHNLLFTLLEDTDQRIGENKTVSLSFIFSVLLWQPVKKMQAELQKTLPPPQAFEEAINHILSQQLKTTAIPRRVSTNIREIWGMQYILFRHSGKRPLKLIHNLRFRAAFDFLCLSAHADPGLTPAVEWWQQFIDSTEKQRKQMCSRKKFKPTNKDD